MSVEILPWIILIIVSHFVVYKFGFNQGRSWGIGDGLQIARQQGLDLLREEFEAKQRAEEK